MKYEDEWLEDVTRRRRKGLIPAILILGGLVALLTWSGVRSIATRQVEFSGSQRLGNSGGSPGPSKTVRGNDALLSGVGNLVTAAAIAVLLVAVIVDQFFAVNVLAKAPARVVPGVLLLTGIVLMFLPASCSRGRNNPPNAAAAPAGAYNR